MIKAVESAVGPNKVDAPNHDETQGVLDVHARSGPCGENVSPMVDPEDEAADHLGVGEMREENKGTGDAVMKEHFNEVSVLVILPVKKEAFEVVAYRCCVVNVKEFWLLPYGKVFESQGKITIAQHHWRACF